MATARILRRWKRVTGLARSLAPIPFSAYLLIAAVSTWPLPRFLGVSLPQGTEAAATVPLFTTWTVWWNADRALHSCRGYWDAPIFHPTPDSFAFSEPMTTTLAVAPLIWLSGNRILAHNIFLVLALALNGWAGFHLLRRVRVGRLAAVLGGAIIELLPLVHHELGVLQLVPLCGILWTIHSLHQLGVRPCAVRGARLGAAFAFTYLTCAYYGLFLSVLLILGAGWLLGRQVMAKRTWTAISVAGAVSFVLLFPVVVAQLRVARQNELVRSRELVDRLSADAADYWTVPLPRWLEPVIPQLRHETHFPLCPGIVTSGLALCGAGIGLIRPRYRSWTAFCLTVLLGALLLSLGPEFQLANWSPYATLMDWYPGFAQVRSAFRFAIFVQLITALLAGLGLHALGQAGQNIVGSLSVRGSSPGISRRIRVGAMWVCTITLAASSLLEIWPSRPVIYSPPPVSTQQRWIDWIQANTSRDSVIACLPFPEGTNTASYEQTALWMYWGTFHQRKLVNGYSGFLPQSYLTTKQEMSRFPDAASIHRLQQQGAAYCVVSRSFLERADIEGDPVARRYLEWLDGDAAAGVDIYRLDKTDD